MLTPETFAVPDEDIERAVEAVSDEEYNALRLAADRIRAYHEKQLPKDEKWTDSTGAM